MNDESSSGNIEAAWGRFPRPMHAGVTSLETGFLRLDLNPKTLCGIGRTATVALATFNKVCADRNSEALLICPQNLDGVAILHALGCLQRLDVCDRERLTTLFFPWSRNSVTCLREVLVDREALCKSVLQPLSRMDGKATPSSMRYALALHSLKSVLDHNKQSEKLRSALESNPGLEHPTLFEIMPQIGLHANNMHGYAAKFVERLRKYTWLKLNKGDEDAVNPATTPFFFMGIGLDAARVDILRHAGLDPAKGGRKPDILLLDLSRKPRRRFGNQWKHSVSELLDVLLEFYVDNAPPVLAVTDDVFCLQELRHDLLKEYDRWRSADVSAKRNAAYAQVVLNSSESLFAPLMEVGESIPKVAIDVYGTDGLRTIQEGLQLRRQLLGDGESELAEIVTSACRIIQNLLSLPGEPQQFYKYLHDQYEGFPLETKGARFDHVKARSQVRNALEDGRAGRHQSQMQHFLSAIDALVSAISKVHPGSRRFDECLRQVIKKGGKSIVVLPSHTELDFVKWRMENDPFLFDIKPDNGKAFLLTDRVGAHDALVKLEAHPDGEERIVFVEPHFETLLHVLGRNWIPARVMILCNHARAEQLVKRLHIILSLVGIEKFKPRLAAIEQEIAKASGAHTSDIGDLDLELKPVRTLTVDLTAEALTSSGAIRTISLSGGFHIKAFDGSELALFDEDAPYPYSKCAARDVKPGDQICVFTSDFIEAARSLLKLAAHAPTVLSKYHSVIAKAAERLPGENKSQKASELRERMLAIDPNAPLPGQQAISHWIEVEHLANVPRDEVRPQAPQKRENYDLFMKALGISDVIAEQYWVLGIFGTRSARIKTGAYFHQVLMAVLIDPHSLGSRLPELDPVDMWRINQIAEDYVEAVISNEIEVFQ